MPNTFKIMILVGTLLVGGGLVYKYNLDKTKPHVRSFHVKECFIFRDSKSVDGVVTSFNDTEYTVMWSVTANRRFAGTKIGYRVPITWLDQYASRVTCPWKSLYKEDK